jgi:putative Mg2+ transporter-C (MgtC) family protein
MTSDFIIRLFVASLLGTIIGLDREYRQKSAGFRTHFLVSMGSALFMIISQYGFDHFASIAGDVRLDPSRVAAQVVSGIGFIGAGTIIIQRQFIKGLTTAAGLWATAGIGMACGAGMYWVALAATLLALIALELLGLIFRSLDLKNNFIVFSTPDKDILKKILVLQDKREFKIVSYAMETREEENTPTIYVITLGVKSKISSDEKRFLNIMEQLPNVTIEKIN